MRLVHLTAKRFFYTTADSFYIYNLAENFSKLLKDDYLLVVGEKAEGQFKGVNLINLHLKPWFRGGALYFWSQYVYYIFWLPRFFLSRKRGEDMTVFSSDSTVLPAVIFLKKMFRFKYKVCSDWHMLYNNWRDGYVAHGSDYLITTSQKLKRLITEKTGIDPDRTKTVYGGVDLEKFKDMEKSAARMELGLPTDKKLIGYIGLFKTMGMEKGISTMIESLKYLPEDFEMVFAGGKEDEIEHYKKIADGLGVAVRCIFAGRMDFGNVIEYQQAMDILVIPYPDKPHFRNYGFPMKVYEYMASKRPIIYSKLELSEEVLHDCGFLFEPDNPEDLAEKILSIMDEKNKEIVENKVNIAYNKVVGYSWERKAREIVEFILK
jgi:glycosyltransferase involved in cell wall biosynthesis